MIALSYRFVGLLLLKCFASADVIEEFVPSVIFDAESKLSHFEKYGPCGSGILSIQVPASVEMVCERWNQC
jgi:hypothetical protein